MIDTHTTQIAHTTTLPSGGKLVEVPSSIIVYNFAPGDEAVLSQALSANPGIPVLFLIKVYYKEVFSQADTHNRTFVMAAKFVNRDEVNPNYPAMWLEEGDFMPEVPGHLQVTATDRGFQVDTIPPDPEKMLMFI